MNKEKRKYISEIDARNRAFMRQCRHLSETKTYSVDELSEIASNMPAPEYFVGYEYAAKMLHHYLVTGEIRAKQPLTRRMWEEIFGRTEVYRHQNRCTYATALQMVLTAGEASCYFITPSTARSLFYKINRDLRHADC